MHSDDVEIHLLYGIAFLGNVSLVIIQRNKGDSIGGKGIHVGGGRHPKVT
jgi:hypothetical protein